MQGTQSPLRPSLRRNTGTTPTKRTSRRHTLSCNDAENAHPNVHWKASPVQQKFIGKQVIRNGGLKRAEEMVLSPFPQFGKPDEMIVAGAPTILDDADAECALEQNGLPSMVRAISPVRKSSSFYHRDSIHSNVTADNWIAEATIHEGSDSLAPWSEIAPSFKYDKSSASYCDDTFDLSSSDTLLGDDEQPAKVLLPRHAAGATNDIYSKCTAFPRSGRFVDFRRRSTDPNSTNDPQKCGCKTVPPTKSDSWWPAQYLSVFVHLFSVRSTTNATLYV
jgi:hypothetical protein